MNYFDTEDGKMAARVLWRDLGAYFSTLDREELDELDRRIAGRAWRTPEGQRQEQIVELGDCYTISEAAPLIGKSVAVLLRMARSGQIGAFKAKGLGNAWYIWRGTVEAYLRGVKRSPRS